MSTMHYLSCDNLNIIYSYSYVFQLNINNNKSQNYHIIIIFNYIMMRKYTNFIKYK